MFMNVERVHFSYPEKPGEQAQLVLDNISFSVSEGEYVAIIGHNGSGKSTLAKLLGGLIHPTDGTIRVLGKDISDVNSIGFMRQHIGMVFQNPDNQMIATVVEEDIAFGLENLCVPRTEMHARVEAALRSVGMLEHRHRPPHHLSGGQKQRIAIAAVMAMRPSCIIFDEATSMLDVEGRREVLALMDTLHREGKTILTITHHMSEALRAGRIIVMDSGRIVMDGSPQEVFTRIEELRALKLDVPIAIDVGVQLGITNVISNDDLAMRLAERAKRDLVAKSTDEMADVNTSKVTAVVSANRPPIIQTVQLSHRYMRKTPMEQSALKDITLQIQSGEIVAVVGHTGSGKSTLVQHFNALIEAQAGEVIVDGMQVGARKSELKSVRQTVGLVFQNPEDQLFETLIGDDIAYGPFQYGMSVEEARERVRDAMEIVGLDFSWRDRPVGRLSGGQKRKVAIAGVIAMMPKVLVLDEPTAGLDPKSRDELLHSIQALNRRHGTTIIIVTHQMEEVARLVNRVFVLSKGQLVRQTTPRTLFKDRMFLKTYGLGVPESVELADMLKDVGVPVSGVPLTREEAVTMMQSLLGKGDSHGVL